MKVEMEKRESFIFLEQKISFTNEVTRCQTYDSVKTKAMILERKVGRRIFG